MSDERKIINSCNELTMDKFIRCLVKNDKSCLVVSGEFTDDEKEKNWEYILLDYFDLLNSNKTKLLIKLIKDIGKNECKVEVINLCVLILSNQNEVISDEAFDICTELLKKYNYNYDIPKNDYDKRIEILRSINNTCKMAVINLKRDRKSKDNLLKSKQEKIINETNFDKIFISLNCQLKYGFKITPQNTTVSEYCNMIQMLKIK